MQDINLLKTIQKEDNYSDLSLTPEQKDAYLKEFHRNEIIRKRIEERNRIIEKMETEKRREALNAFLKGDESGF